MHLSRSAIVCFALALVLAGALSGCGRRGGLELPPDAKPKKVVGQPAAPVSQEPKRAFQKKNVPERPFILDGLI